MKLTIILIIITIIAGYSFVSVVNYEADNSTTITVTDDRDDYDKLTQNLANKMRAEEQATQTRLQAERLVLEAKEIEAIKIKDTNDAVRAINLYRGE